jgi:periplasmic protein TonB
MTRVGHSGEASIIGRAILAALVVVTAGLLASQPLRAAAPRLQVFFASDFTDAAYQKQTYQKAASAWKRPAKNPKPGGKAVVIAVIQKDGSIPPPTLHLASGSDEWDAAALEAVKSAAPFPPLPKGYARPSVEVHFHFEYL